MAYNVNDQAQHDALKAEVLLPAHEAARDEGNHQAIANALNQPQAGITVRRGPAPSHMVMSAIIGTEFASLAAGPRDYLMALVSAGLVDLSNDNVRSALGAAFPAGTTSRANLIALADKTPASRAEQMFGVGTVITVADVGTLLNE
jgi:hypothetical protein